MATDTRTIECKNCEARYKVPANFNAHKITCKRCNSPIFLRTRTPTRKHTTRRYTRVKGNPKPKKISPLMYASGIGCVVLVAAIIIMLV